VSIVCSGVFEDVLDIHSMLCCLLFVSCDPRRPCLYSAAWAGRDAVVQPPLRGGEKLWLACQ
jgi:hypothetical protein